jgi:hypothetical protein
MANGIPHQDRTPGAVGAVGEVAVMTCPSGAVRVFVRCVGGWLLVLDHFLRFDTSPGEQRSTGGHQVTQGADALETG